MTLSMKSKSVLFAVLAMALSFAFAQPQGARAGNLFGDMMNAPYDWSGLYVGGQIGYIAGTAEDHNNFSCCDLDYKGDGFAGGGHIGYNWQNGDAVFGFVADVNFTDLGDKDGYVFGPFTTTGKYDVDLTASFRGKVGVTLTDRVLLFATAGLAIAEEDHYITTVVGAAVTPDSFDKTHLGFTVGGGLEMAVTDWISTYVEYRFTQYGDESFGVGIGAHDFALETHQLQGGVSFHFNSWLSGGI